MLDRQLKQAYQKITPSSELKHNILAMEAQTKKRESHKILLWKPVATMAACLVLFLGGIMVASQMGQIGHPEILLQEELIPAEGAMSFVPEVVTSGGTTPRAAFVAPAAHTAESNRVAIDLTITSGKSLDLIAKQGTLYLVSEQNGEEFMTDVGSAVSLNEKNDVTLVRWVISVSDMDAEYQMMIGKEVIGVTYQAATNEFWISRNH